MKSNHRFCILPWIHIHLNTEGDVYPCCVSWNSQRTAKIGWLKNNTLEELFNSKFMKQLRLDMVNGVPRPDVCGDCYKHEDNGFRSARIGSNEEYSDEEIANIVATMDEDGTVPEKITSWDVRFSNVCNLKCRTCGSVFSTTWGKEIGAFPVLINAIKDPLSDPMESQYDNVTKIYFAGGEPLLMTEHFRTLDRLIAHKRAKQVKLIYNSNLTVIDHNGKSIFDYWREFKEVVVGVSIDAVKERAEYIRSGTSWNSVEDNLSKLTQFASQNPTFNFYYSPTISIFNIDHLCDMHQYLWNNILMKYIDSIQFNILQYPRHYSCKILPPNMKQKIIEKINLHCEWLKKNGATDETINNYNNLKDYISDETDIDSASERRMFIGTTKRLDLIRDEDFLTVFPEYALIYE